MKIGSDNVCPCSNSPVDNSNEKKNIDPSALPEPKENENNENGHSSIVRLSNLELESIDEEMKEEDIDKDFMALKINAEEDVSEWSQLNINADASKSLI